MYPRSLFAKLIEPTAPGEYYDRDSLKKNKLDKFMTIGRITPPRSDPDTLHRLSATLRGSLSNHITRVGNFLETRDEKCGISRFDVLYMRSYSLKGNIGFAMRLLLFLPRTVEMARLLTRHNVPVPLGGMMVRNLETHWSHDCINLGDTQLGQRIFKGPMNFVSFASHSQDVEDQAIYKVGYLLDDPDKWYTQSNFIAGAYIAGKGDGYITQLPDRQGSNASRVGAKVQDAFLKAIPTELHNHDWVPFMTTYNSAMEEPREGIDVTGVWSVVTAVGQLHRSPDFDTFRKKPMFNGVFFLNSQIKFLRYGISSLDDIKTLNQLQRAALERANTICQPATYLRFDPVSGKKREYNATQNTAYHFLGPQVPGRYELETALSPPSQEIVV